MPGKTAIEAFLEKLKAAISEVEVVLGLVDSTQPPATPAEVPAEAEKETTNV